MQTVEINQDTCIGCKKCVKICPMQMLKMNDDKKAYVVDETLCDAAYGCVRICPVNAISKKTI